MLIQDQQNMLIQDHVLHGKITLWQEINHTVNYDVFYGLNDPVYVLF